tara:strand:- start:1099 stop:1485 length:387 start_codon:yes stop_codon:yes gene_type:complete
MPSSLKRIGYLPRQEIGKIIAQIATEENLSKSKVVGVLVEESLAARGIYKNKSSTRIKSESIFHESQNSIKRNALFEIKEKEELISDSGFSLEKESLNSQTHNLHTYISEEDLTMLARIKNLKSLGLL